MRSGLHDLPLKVHLSGRRTLALVRSGAADERRRNAVPARMLNQSSSSFNRPPCCGEDASDPWVLDEPPAHVSAGRVLMLSARRRALGRAPGARDVLSDPGSGRWNATGCAADPAGLARGRRVDGRRGHELIWWWRAPCRMYFRLQGMRRKVQVALPGACWRRARRQARGGMRRSDAAVGRRTPRRRTAQPVTARCRYRLPKPHRAGCARLDISSARAPTMAQSGFLHCAGGTRRGAPGMPQVVHWSPVEPVEPVELVPFETGGNAGPSCGPPESELGRHERSG
jgi:hypothetical protein